MLKGGKLPEFALIHPETNKPCFFKGNVSKGLERAERVISHPLLENWSVSKDKTFETDRGVASKTTIAYLGKDVVEVTNDGRGGMSFIKDLTSVSCSEKLVSNIREAFKDAGKPFHDDTHCEFVINEFIFYELSRYRAIMSLKDYINFNI